MWHVLQSSPQQERKLGRLLKKSDFLIYIAAEKVWVRAGGARRKKMLREKPLFPRMVFFQFPNYPISGQDRGWRFLSKIHMIDAVLTRSGRPVEIPHEDMANLMFRASAGEFGAPDVAQFMRRGEEFAKGDTARISVGQFEGHTVEIEDLCGETGEAHFWLNILGAKRKAKAPIEHLEKAS